MPSRPASDRSSATRRREGGRGVRLRSRPTASSTSSITPMLVGVVEHYGLSWFEKTCAAFIASENPYRSSEGASPDRRISWLRGLPKFVLAICESGGNAATELARRIIAEQWAWVLGQYRDGLRLLPSAILLELARLDGAILGVLDSSVACGAASVQADVLNHLRARLQSFHGIRHEGLSTMSWHQTQWNAASPHGDGTDFELNGKRVAALFKRSRSLAPLSDRHCV